MQIIKTIIFLSFILISIDLWGQELYQNNQTIILNETTSHLASKFPDALKNNTYALRFNDATDQSLGQLQSMLFAIGIPLSTNYSSSPILQVSVNSDNELLRLSKSEWQRTISAIVVIQAVDTSGSILWVDQITVQYNDTIISRSIPNLVTDWEPARFHKEQTRRPGLRILRYVESVLISSAVATTIYLLYNVRSQ